MGGGRVIVDDYADGAVAAEVLDIPFCREGVVLLVGLEKHRLIVVRAERNVVQSPEETACRVDEETDVVGYGCGGCFQGDGICWNGLGEVVIGAGSRIGDVPGGTFWCFGGIGTVVVDCCESVGLFGCRAEGGNIGAHPESRVRGASVRGDQNVCSLANAESYHVCSIWFLKIR